ncbi:MAG: hypothetical protein Fur0010_15120 [Bdellovibrio sp.]
MKKILLPIILFPSIANAVNINLLQHSHSPIYMQTEDTLTKNSLPNETLIYSAYYNYVEDPLIMTNADRTERVGTLVEGINALHFGVGYQSSNRFLIGVSSFGANVYLPSREGIWAMGDTKIIGKYRLTGDNVADSFALIPEIELPTGDDQLFVSNKGVGTGIKLAYEKNFGFMRLNLNTGYMYNSQAVLKDLDYRNRLNFAVGAHVPLGNHWGIISEAVTTRTFKRYQNPGEVYIGSRYQMTNNLAINAGAAIGNLGGVGSNEFRLLAGLKWVPQMKGNYHFKTIMSKLTEREKKALAEILEIRDEIKFDHDSFTLNQKSKLALNKIAHLLKDEDHDFQRIVIEGHANSIGSEDYNLSLSEKRAHSVKEYLLTQGIRNDLLEVKALGESQPKAIDEWSMAKIENRRVEFHVEK